MAKTIPRITSCRNARIGSRRNVRIGSHVRGRVVSWSSVGSCGFRGTKRGTPFAAQTIAENAIRTIVDQGMQRAEVMIRVAVSEET
ncbi:small ribosomal subunit protein uS11c-like [Cornus florida]|uniref:small ribosomal subunit protein uS11c-like n=1 Tax=Cornus florida TaxID=4283 RepID=UPI00289E1007|nr:small ribosomal subunit protein uS11c-like [Cornus florida]